MIQDNAFQSMMKSLWKVMSIDFPAESENEVYSITFPSDVEVHLLCTHEGSFDIISEAGVLINKNAGSTILDLLALNDPPLMVNVDRESSSVMVWARQSIAGTDMDDLIELINLLTRTVLAVRATINCSDWASLLSKDAARDPGYVPPRGGTTLAQLRRRN
jgi:hypothetical protein